METKQLKLINEDIINLDISSDTIQNHFNNPRCCTIPILNQTNSDYYNKFVNEEDKVILDLGANIGLVSMHLSSYADKVISVEPTPSHFSILKHFTKDFKNIECVQGAISDKKEITQFYILEDTTENSLVSEKGGIEVNVQTYTLKNIIDMFDLESIDFVKIDIEGSEIKFLSEENIKTLGEYVRKFFIEFHTINGIHYRDYRDQYNTLFSNLGWEVENLNEDSLYCYRR
jgi:FkbM family methyltransferase